ncbi:MAG: zinc ribbon domain-containing protein [Chloracidobacterium sp.]|nr:zinc ribbon domain-containing protein [Chloracidobacterium sp.]
MPIYEYKCQQCGAQLEVRQGVSDKPLTTCEKCHGKLEKQWSLSGFQFKGAGWYVTDYAGKKTESSSKVESTVASDTASKPTDKTTTASDAKVSKPEKT